MTEEKESGGRIGCGLPAERRKIQYPPLFWLFFFGSLGGVVMEGAWYALTHGAWETHVVSIWGPFCIIYGLGAVGCYVGAVLLEDKRLPTRFLAYTAIGSAVELLCGLLLKYGLHMRAWNYSKQLFNFRGLISLKMAVIWGFVGIVFERMVPRLDRIFQRMEGGIWRFACLALSVFMAVNLMATAVCLVRWSQRHDGASAENRVEEFLDTRYSDEWMKERFCEWRFIKDM